MRAGVLELGGGCWCGVARLGVSDSHGRCCLMVHCGPRFSVPHGDDGCLVLVLRGASLGFPDALCVCCVARVSAFPTAVLDAGAVER